MKIYKKIVSYREVKNKSLDDILLEIAKPIIKRNRENHWEDDTYLDIFCEFDDFYKYDKNDFEIIEDKIKNLIKTL